MAYCGQTRSPVLIARLTAAGVGECTVRGELHSRKRDPWFYDNGAYRDWVAGLPFNGVRFARDCSRMRTDLEFGKARPDFVVVPDLVAAGEASLAFTAAHRPDVAELPAYLAVQNGMTVARVRAWLAEQELPYAGLFVGGSLDWKLSTSASWIELAHAIGLRCHIGRVGTPTRVRWARSIGADSIDSCLPLMHEKHTTAFLGALAEA